jgi:putative pyruvate formate lyase activating enzyme
MVCLDAKVPVVRFGSRCQVAAQRIAAARENLEHCTLCDHRCGVNRLNGELGLCRAGADTRFFSAQTEVADELELIPVFAIALSGCDLRCDFCVTGQSSWNPRAGLGFEVVAMAERAQKALDQGARTIMLLGGEPTIHLAAVLEFVALMPDAARLVWKTNAHGSSEARALLAGMFDVWVADYKFGNEACAQRLARVSSYNPSVRENLLWASDDCDLIVRHLLMPGHIECCWLPIVQWLSTQLPGVKVSLRTGFWPGWHSARHAELRQMNSHADLARAWEIAQEFGLSLIE